ncbi:MAG: Tfp pilus assembly protein PilF [Deltaproteobacteria bacterium]|nr:Tfp pilus assembly protein PilF [Deltaproteobacteria bacterium]
MTEMGRSKLVRRVLIVLFFTVAIWALISTGVSQAVGGEKVSPAKSMGYAGSVSCRECHERFYQLWSTSRHGLAMQPYTSDFAKKNLTPQEKEVKIGKSSYRPDIAGDNGWILEKGPKSQKKYKIEHVLGGKNVYYFLTPFPRGRLQTLPLAYDFNKKEWFDTAASGIRHFPGRSETDEPLSWRDQQYTFNTACYSCHVSQLSTNYDLKTDMYHTVWAEPGINCETCHGPCEEHNRVCREAPKGTVPKDLKIIRDKSFTVEQHNSNCGTCHAKMNPLTAGFTPGDRFFDHYDLATLEDPDFYPDGRDLGENYTYTLWRMSPCVKSGKLSCMHCHTSSGRYRFKQEEKANEACMPCHKQRVENATAHTHHKADSPGNKCISCHMPMTDFARMRRSDHSMLPPTPAATIAYKSPNACNLCHKDKDPAWADKWVRQWRKRDYQAPILYRAGLIDAARKRDWKRLPEMLTYLESKDRDEIYATSLIRLLRYCEDPKKWPVMIKAMKDPSPLVRGAAAESLTNTPSPQTTGALLEATGDGYRLVRIRAAMVLAAYPAYLLKDEDRSKFARATEEYFVSILSRPDQWSSHYNLGNYFLQRDDLPLALGAYETAEKLEPRAILPYVNASIVYARMGDKAKAEESLNKALKINPKSAAANFNLGLLKAEQNDLPKAEQYLRAALKEDPTLAVAAYNLCVITARDRISEAVTWCRKAAELRPQDPKYAYTLAFYLNQKGDREEAVRTLKAIIEKYPGYKDAEMLLREISKKEKRP